MSDEVSSIGQTLRTAREEQGLSVEEVAARLRLMQRQVVAIESDDFASLGQPVFARGFVRNYAKLLDLPYDALLARMTGDSTETRVVTQAPSPPARSWLMPTARRPCPTKALTRRTHSTAGTPVR
jgi:cytoskeleton protein RodZ